MNRKNDYIRLLNHKKRMKKFIFLLMVGLFSMIGSNATAAFDDDVGVNYENIIVEHDVIDVIVPVVPSTIDQSFLISTETKTKTCWIPTVERFKKAEKKSDATFRQPKYLWEYGLRFRSLK